MHEFLVILMLLIINFNIVQVYKQNVLIGKLLLEIAKKELK